MNRCFAALAADTASLTSTIIRATAMEKGFDSLKNYLYDIENIKKNTPVIFVTGLVDFEHRTKSKLSGGNDFIAKPFLFIELALKALLNVMRHRSPPGQA